MPAKPRRQAKTISRGRRPAAVPAAGKTVKKPLRGPGKAAGIISAPVARAPLAELRKIELVAPAKPAVNWPAESRLTRTTVPTGWAWLERLLGKSRQATVDNRQQQDKKLADVQAAVMSALADRASPAPTREPGASSRWNGAWTGRVARRLTRWWQRKWSARQRAVAGIMLILVLLVVLYQGHTPDGPAQAVAQIRHSIVKGNVAAFEQQVDVAAVATSAVNQLFGGPVAARTALLPGAAREWDSGDVPQTEPVLGSSLKERLETYLKPGLADSLKDEMLDTVARRSWRAASQAEPDSLLLHLWQLAGGEKLRLGETRIVSADAERAAAEVMLRRPDLQLALPLRLELDRSEGSWQLVDLPNLADVLNQLSQADGRLTSRASAKAVDELGHLLVVSDVTKARLPDGQLLVGLRLTNTGPVDLRDLRLQLVFADAAGQPMKVALLDEPGVLASGAVRQKTWAVMIDPRYSLERYVRDLPLDALTVNAGVIGVTLPGGRKLTTALGR